MNFIRSVFEVLGFKAAPGTYVSRFQARIPVVEESEMDFLKRKQLDSYKLKDYKPSDIHIHFGPDIFEKFVNDEELMAHQECKEFVRKVSRNKYVSVKIDQISTPLKSLIDFAVSKDLITEEDTRLFDVRHFKIYRPMANLLLQQEKKEFAYGEVNKSANKTFDKNLIEDVLKGHYRLTSIPGVYDDIANGSLILDVKTTGKSALQKHFSQMEEEGLILMVGESKDFKILVNKEKFINVWLTSPFTQNYQSEKKERNQRYDKYISEERAKLHDKELSGKERREVFVALKKHEKNKYLLKR